MFGPLTNVVSTARGQAVRTSGHRARLRAAASTCAVYYGVDDSRDHGRLRPPDLSGSPTRTGPARRPPRRAPRRVMRRDFVNYSAGTLGASMVEGPDLRGVLVGDHSDVGGEPSIMGTLSAAAPAIISIGERCLLGANAGFSASGSRRRLRHRGRLLRHRRREITILDMDDKPKVVKAARALRLPATSCSGATASPAPSRRSPGRARHRPQRRPAPQLGDPATHGETLAAVRRRRGRPRARRLGIAHPLRRVGPLLRARSARPRSMGHERRT